MSAMKLEREDKFASIRDNVCINTATNKLLLIRHRLLALVKVRLYSWTSVKVCLEPMTRLLDSDIR